MVRGDLSNYAAAVVVRVVTDSACDLTDDEITTHGIEVVPLSIRFGDKEFTDRVELSVDQFYSTMAESEHLPETAAPAPGAFEAAFRKQAEAGADEIVCLNLSYALSATGQSAQTAATAIADDLAVTCIDTKSISAGQGAMVLAAAKAAADGASVADIQAIVDDMQPRTRIYGILDTLENLKKGGRIGGAQAMLGTMLSIKPCVDLSTGETQEAGRQRTRKKAVAWLKSTVLDAGNVEQLTVISGKAPDAADFVAALQAELPDHDIALYDLGAVIGSHGRAARARRQVPRHELTRSPSTRSPTTQKRVPGPEQLVRVTPDASSARVVLMHR